MRQSAPIMHCLFLSLRFAGQVNLILRRRATAGLKTSQWDKIFRRKAAALRNPLQPQPGLSTGSRPVAATGKLGLSHQSWKALRMVVDENRAEINFELVERLAER